MMTKYKVEEISGKYSIICPWTGEVVEIKNTMKEAMTFIDNIMRYCS